MSDYHEVTVTIGLGTARKIADFCASALEHYPLLIDTEPESAETKALI